MAMKRFSCRTHGGIFNKEAKRGRQPVRCTTEYPCDKADDQASPEKVAAVGRRIAQGIPRSVIRDVPGVGKVAVVTQTENRPMRKVPLHPATPGSYALVPAENAPKPLPMTAHRAAKREAMEQGYGKQGNSSLPLAMRAKAQLEPVGWAVKGRAWLEERVGMEHWAEIIASRGAETLVMRWQNGILSAQDYSLEHLKPSLNNMPDHNLGFDPDELTDRELVQKISGMKVTWWNTLGSSTESAVVPGDRVKVEHIFVGNGDEDNSKRVVTFVDRNNGGFRSFHSSALMKVG